MNSDIYPAVPVKCTGPNIICPNANCGYKGYSRAVPRGSWLMGLALTACFILPGIIYFIVYSGVDYECPNCGAVARKKR